jgi:hypothetical protein
MNRKFVNQKPNGVVLPRADPDNDDQHGENVLAGAGLAPPKAVCRAVKPRDNREVLVCLTRTGLIAHHAMVAATLERNQRLLEELGKQDVAVLLGHVDRLTDMAAKMLDAKKGLN